MWQEPIFDRTNADTLTVRAGQSNIENHKGALNYQDLNRIEQNFQYVVQHLFDNAMVVPHTKREYTETTFECVEQEVSVLPDGYTQLEYIESTGTQYIDTGVIATQNTGYEIDFLTNSQLVQSESFGAILCCIKSGTNRFGFDTYTSYDGGSLYYGSTIHNPDIIVGKRMTVSLMNGVLKTPSGETTLPANTFNVGASVALFARKWNTGTIDGYSKTRIYACRMYDGSVLIRNLIPCKNTSEIAGLYDLVEGKFYENAGTGNFRYVIKHKLPSGYTQVEYIQSSGTQFIDTGFAPNNNTRVVMDVQPLSVSSPEDSTVAMLFGARTAATSNNYAFAINFDKMRTDYNNAYDLVFSADPLSRVTIDKNKESTTVDAEILSYANAPFQAPVNLTLFALNHNGTVKWKASAKLYYCMIYDNGTLIRNYVPCVDPSGVAGLYDLINLEFYTSAGTDAFSVGPEIKLEIETVVTLEEITKTYTDWQEANIPWKSEIDRIRENFNSLTNLFLRSLNLPIFASSDYLMYSEVNDWERVSLVGKTMFDNMEKEYVYSGTIDCGGDRLL